MFSFRGFSLYEYISSFPPTRFYVLSIAEEGLHYYSYLSHKSRCRWIWCRSHYANSEMLSSVYQCFFLKIQAVFGQYERASSSLRAVCKQHAIREYAADIVIRIMPQQGGASHYYFTRASSSSTILLQTMPAWWLFILLPLLSAHSIYSILPSNQFLSFLLPSFLSLVYIDRFVIFLQHAFGLLLSCLLFVPILRFLLLFFLSLDWCKHHPAAAVAAVPCRQT